MIELMQNGVEYTEVRAIGSGAIPIGHDIVYPPLNEPPKREDLEGHGIDMSSGSPEAVRSLNYYKSVVKRYEDSKKAWFKVVSRDPNRGIDNRKLIEFYKERKELEEKDEKQVRKYYEDLDKKKQQKT